MSTMQALVLRSHGAADSAELARFERPEPEPGEVLIRIRAASINRVDLYMRASGAGITHLLPQIMGIDGVGEIAENRDPESALVPGDRVAIYPGVFCGQCRYCLAGDQPLCLNVRYAGEHRHGTLAEFIAVPSRCVVKLPDTIDFHAASCLPVAYLTAWRMLFGKAGLNAGETVAVIGIGGGVAVATLQLAKLAGARVIVTSSSDEKLRRAAALGADAGINYRSEDVAKRILELTEGNGADVVIDSVGGASWSASLKSVARGGRVVTCGATAGGGPSAELQRVFIRQIQIFGSTLGSHGEFCRLIDTVARHRLAPVIDRLFGFEEAMQALDYLESGAQFGKVVVDLS